MSSHYEYTNEARMESIEQNINELFNEVRALKNSLEDIGNLPFDNEQYLDHIYDELDKIVSPEIAQIEKDTDKLRIIIRLGLDKWIEQKLIEQNQPVNHTKVAEIIIRLGMTQSKNLKSIGPIFTKLKNGTRSMNEVKTDTELRKMNLLK